MLDLANTMSGLVVRETKRSIPAMLHFFVNVVQCFFAPFRNRHRLRAMFLHPETTFYVVAMLEVIRYSAGRATLCCLTQYTLSSVVDRIDYNRPETRHCTVFPCEG